MTTSRVQSMRPFYRTSLRGGRRGHHRRRLTDAGRARGPAKSGTWGFRPACPREVPDFARGVRPSLGLGGFARRVPAKSQTSRARAGQVWDLGVSPGVSPRSPRLRARGPAKSGTWGFRPACPREVPDFARAGRPSLGLGGFARRVPAKSQTSRARAGQVWDLGVSPGVSPRSPRLRARGPAKSGTWGFRPACPREVPDFAREVRPSLGLGGFARRVPAKSQTSRARAGQVWDLGVSPGVSPRSPRLRGSHAAA